MRVGPSRTGGSCGLSDRWKKYRSSNDPAYAEALSSSRDAEGPSRTGVSPTLFRTGCRPWSIWRLFRVYRTPGMVVTGRSRGKKKAAPSGPLFSVEGCWLRVVDVLRREEKPTAVEGCWLRGKEDRGQKSEQALGKSACTTVDREQE